MPPNLTHIRTLLIEGFSEDDLRTFCFDTPKFKPVHHELAQLNGKKAIVQHLLEFAERQECLVMLLDWAKTQNPAKYEKHQPYFEGDTAPTPAELAAARTRYLAQIIARHQDLDFVGIPELKDRHALLLDEIFINLQAEMEISAGEAALFVNEGGGKRTAHYIEAKHFVDVITGAGDKIQSLGREPLKRQISVNEALQEQAKIVILGDPGAGKTTLLKYITLAFAQDQPHRLGLEGEARLPIFVRLYDFVAKRANHRGDYSLLDYLYTQAHENLLLDLPAGFFEIELEQGQCCICLDGLDELGAAGLRRDISAAVASLTSRYPDNRYLITSRLVGYEEAPLDRRDFSHHTILPFGDDEIHLFVQKWYEAREKDPAAARRQAGHLIETIIQEPRLKDLAANPLMLTIMALVHRIEAELPHERVKLYDKCVTAMMETWEQVKRLSVEDRERPYYKKRRYLLEQLAYWLHTQPLKGTSGKGRTREVAEGDLKAQLAQFLLADPQLKLDKRSAWQEAQDFVFMVQARTGLLVERGEGVYSFAHLTFQEYLTAEYIKYEYAHSIDELWQVIQPHLHAPAWREVILLLLGSLNEFRQHPTELVRRIFERTDEYEEVLHRHHFLAAYALADRVQVDVTLNDRIVDKLLTIARFDDLGRREALTILGMLPGNERSSSGLLTVAQDVTVDTWMRIAFAATLGQLGREDEVTNLMLSLAQDESLEADVRSVAIGMLGPLGQIDKITNHMIILARNPTVATEVRRTAAQVLGELGQTHQAADLLLALAGDEQVDNRVRRVAIQGLGRLNLTQPDILSSLLVLASNHEIDAEVRSDAAQTLGQLGWIDQAATLLLTLACFRHRQPV